MVKVATVLLVSLLAVVFGTGAQNKQPNAGQPEKESKVEKYVRVTIAPIVYSRQARDYVPTTQFKAGSLMRIAILMTNTSNEPLAVGRFGSFMHDRLRLLKDGKPVSYLHDVPKKIKASDENENVFVSPREAVLEPNRESNYDQIDLSEWYGQLQPGHYELTLRHRFGWRGKLVESNTVAFDVVP